jgi:hypothetical protein
MVFNCNSICGKEFECGHRMFGIMRRVLNAHSLYQRVVIAEQNGEMSLVVEFAKNKRIVIRSATRMNVKMMFVNL